MAIETGTLVTVKDKYGFIRPSHAPEGDHDCYVALNALPTGVTPRVGLRLTFQRQRSGETGKLRAVDVTILEAEGNR
jgi:cold shock CspA family protein